jgi:hypothetical protein
MILDIASLQQIFLFCRISQQPQPNNLSPTTSAPTTSVQQIPTISTSLTTSVQQIPTIPTISTIPTNSNNLNNLDHLADLRISPRLAAIAITEELSSPALGGTASK